MNAFGLGDIADQWRRDAEFLTDLTKAQKSTIALEVEHCETTDLTAS